jgi:hypothetical protein
MVVIEIVLKALAAILLADFVSGLIHWLEDAYGREDFPIIGPLITKPNILHHHKPREFTHKNWLQSSWDLVLINLAIVGIAALFRRLTWPVWLFALVSANSNEIHKCAHRTPRENGRFITLLQRLKILQGPRHHAKHHTDPKESHYCAVTIVMNPILDGIGFWSNLEWLIWKTLGVQRREDKSVRPERRRKIAADLAAIG